jgi:hypothetical protein
MDEKGGENGVWDRKENTKHNNISLSHLTPHTHTYPEMSAYENHGNGRPMSTSKMLDPILELTAMSPWPCEEVGE